jgi:hypothetical protein
MIVIRLLDYYILPSILLMLSSPLRLVAPFVALPCLPRLCHVAPSMRHSLRPVGAPQHLTPTRIDARRDGKRVSRRGLNRVRALLKLLA